MGQRDVGSTPATGTPASATSATRPTSVKPRPTNPFYCPSTTKVRARTVVVPTVASFTRPTSGLSS